MTAHVKRTYRGSRNDSEYLPYHCISFSSFVLRFRFGTRSTLGECGTSAHHDALRHSAPYKDQILITLPCRHSWTFTPRASFQTSLLFYRGSIEYIRSVDIMLCISPKLRPDQMSLAFISYMPKIEPNHVLFIRLFPTTSTQLHRIHRISHI